MRKCCHCREQLPLEAFAPSQKHRCKRCQAEYARLHYKKDRDKYIVRASTPEAHKRKRSVFQQCKLLVLQTYGDTKYICCGETEVAFLTLDHTANDGSKQRRLLGNKGRGANFYKWLVDNKYPKGLQVLCFNCNCGRQVNGGVCPHKLKETRYTKISHSFEQSGPGDSIMNLTRPDGHAHLDQKLDKGMRTPWLGQFPQDAGLASPETSAQSGSGHTDSGYSGGGR